MCVYERANKYFKALNKATAYNIQPLKYNDMLQLGRSSKHKISLCRYNKGHDSVRNVIYAGVSVSVFRYCVNVSAGTDSQHGVLNKNLFLNPNQGQEDNEALSQAIAH